MKARLSVFCFHFILPPSSFILRLRLRPAGHAYTGDGVAGCDLSEVWVNVRALGDGFGAARVEAAARGRVNGRRHVALQDDALSSARRVGDGDGRKERARVWVKRAGVKLLGGGDLDDAAQVHDGHAVGDVLNHSQPVRDEEVRKLKL